MYCLLDDKKRESRLKTLDTATPDLLRAENDKGWGVYWVVNSFQATEEEVKKVGVGTKRNEQFLTKLRYIFADLDIAKSGDGQDREAKQAKKTKLLKALLDTFPPTQVIETSNGLQPVWKLEDTEPTPENKRLYRGIIEGIRLWSMEHGALGDNVKHLTQILRLPGFYHHKEEPFMIQICYQNKKAVFVLDELKEVWYKPEDEYVPSAEPIQKGLIGNEIDRIDFQQLIIRAFASAGRNAEFDKQGRVILDGRLTGTFQGKNGDKNYLASSSHEPFKGNRITAVADILGITNKEARSWIMDEYGITYDKVSARQAVEKVKEVHAQPKKEVQGYYTWGTRELTENFAPIKRNSSMVLVGETGDGKSTFAFDLAIKNAGLGHKVLYLSLEMTADELRENIARNYCGMTISEEIYAEIPERKQAAFDRKMAELKAIDNLTVKGIVGNESVNWAMTVEMMKGGYDLVILDNLDLIQGEDREHDLDRQKRISKNILNYCNAEQVPILLLHHYNKAGTSGARSIHNISGSSKISHNAHRVIMLRRKKAKQDKQGVWSVLTDKDKATLYLMLDKARGYEKAFKIIYFYKGTFYDEYPGERKVADIKSWVDVP